MSRRKGQNPEVRVAERADGKEYYFFQYWIDVPGQEERRRQTEVVGLVSQMTRSEAERKKLDFISRLQLNSNDYRIPSSQNFADAVKHYRSVFGPRMLRDSTFSVWDGRLKNHLEPDWNDVPIEHITIDAVNEWAWKKRSAGISWVTIKDALRTMQRVLSSFSKDKKPPFSQSGLAIPERDKLQMKIRSRRNVSFSWAQAKRITSRIRSLDGLGDARREQYSTLFLLAAASGLRSSELFALRVNDVDFKAGTVRVDESSDQRNNGTIGPCKNAAAYRSVLLQDREGKESMRKLKHLLKGRLNAEALVWLLAWRAAPRDHDTESKAVSSTQSTRFAARRSARISTGCNRRWELAGINPAVIRQQMGHSSHRMTALYSGEIPLDQVREAFSSKLLEKMENEAAA
jgi:integrase